jgi:hypothetical protein
VGVAVPPLGNKRGDVQNRDAAYPWLRLTGVRGLARRRPDAWSASTRPGPYCMRVNTGQSVSRQVPCAAKLECLVGSRRQGCEKRRHADM